MSLSVTLFENYCVLHIGKSAIVAITKTTLIAKDERHYVFDVYKYVSI